MGSYYAIVQMHACVHTHTHTHTHLDGSVATFIEPRSSERFFAVFPADSHVEHLNAIIDLLGVCALMCVYVGSQHCAAAPAARD